MFALYELIALLPSGCNLPLPPRLGELYTFLLANEPMQEHEAAQRYLGSDRRRKYFNRLKNDLKKAIIRHLIATPSWSDDHHKALIEDCYRDFACYKILLLNNKRKAAIGIAKALLIKLQKVELYSLTHTIANDLLLHYSSIEPSPQMTKKYDVLAKEQLEIINIESKVRSYHGRMTLICNTRESFSSLVIEEFRAVAIEALTLLRPGIHHINRIIYIIVICRYTATHDYQQIIHFCDEALSSFPKDHPQIRSLSFTFLYNKIPALTALGKLQEAKDTAKKAGEIVPTGNFNWHVVLLRRIVVCLHAEEYQEAYELYKAHTKHECPYPILIEYWNIIRGYLYVLIGADKITPYNKERFYLGKFLNEVPIYFRDKAGNNINILIIQMLVLLQRKQFGHIIDRVESLREYARVYTRAPETKRANIFINMILKMEAASFHRIATERKTQKLREKLNATPIRLGQNLAVEVVPFEVLWTEILTLLENKHRGFRPRKAKAQKRN